MLISIINAVLGTHMLLSCCVLNHGAIVVRQIWWKKEPTIGQSQVKNCDCQTDTISKREPLRVFPPYEIHIIQKSRKLRTS